MQVKFVNNPQKEFEIALLEISVINRPLFVKLYNQFYPEDEKVVLFSDIDSMANIFPNLLSFAKAIYFGEIENWDSNIGFFGTDGSGNAIGFRSVCCEESPISLETLATEILNSNDENAYKKLGFEINKD